MDYVIRAIFRWYNSSVDVKQRTCLRIFMQRHNRPTAPCWRHDRTNLSFLPGDPDRGKRIISVMLFTTWFRQLDVPLKSLQVSNLTSTKVFFCIPDLIFFFPLIFFPTVEKLNSICLLLESFGNCRTRLNTNATRFTNIFSLDCDQSGLVASASVQVKIRDFLKIIKNFGSSGFLFARR